MSGNTFFNPSSIISDNLSTNNLNAASDVNAASINGSSDLYITQNLFVGNMCKLNGYIEHPGPKITAINNKTSDKVLDMAGNNITNLHPNLREGSLITYEYVKKTSLCSFMQITNLPGKIDWKGEMWLPWRDTFKSGYSGEVYDPYNAFEFSNDSTSLFLQQRGFYTFTITTARNGSYSDAVRSKECALVHIDNGGTWHMAGAIHVGAFVNALPGCIYNSVVYSEGLGNDKMILVNRHDGIFAGITIDVLNITVMYYHSWMNQL